MNGRMQFSWSSKKTAPYVFVLPGVIALAALIIYPATLALVNSLQTPNGWGLENYRNILNDSVVWQALWNTCVFTLLSVIGHYLVGLGIALLINRQIYMESFFRVCFLIPWMFPAVVPGIIWMWMLHGQFGIINALLQRFGFIDRYVSWLGNPHTALPMVIIANIWRGFPILMVTFLAGLQTIPEELYDAADVDGAGSLKKFWYITLPHLRAVSVVMLLIDTIWQFNGFTIVQTMTQGGPGNTTQVLATLIYKYAFNYNMYEAGSALGILLLIIMLIPGSLYVYNVVKND